MTQQEEPRWASLLQPIKLLERNWDIDIASELTDYLEELSGLTFEVDGLANLDFAEAAMVIHSSSCTYAKKVDYLLKLTHAAIDSAKAKQTSKKQRRAVRRSASLHGPTAQSHTHLLAWLTHHGRHRLQADVDEDFKTPLDALRAIAAAGAPDNSIADDDFSSVAAPETQPALLMDVSQLASYPTVAHLGAPPVGAMTFSLPLRYALFVPGSLSDSTPCQLCERAAVGSDRKDLRAGAGGTESAAALMSPSDAPTFSLMRAQWHVSGALLLLPSDGAPYDHNFDSVAGGAAMAAPPPQPAAPAPAHNDFHASPNGGFASFGSPAAVAASPEPFFGNGGAAQPGDDAAAPAPSAAGDWYGPDGGDEFAFPGGGDDDGVADAGGVEESGAAFEQPDDAQEAGPLHDEWAELDPHCEDPGENKPFRPLPKKKPTRCGPLRHVTPACIGTRACAPRTQ